MFFVLKRTSTGSHYVSWEIGEFNFMFSIYPGNVLKNIFTWEVSKVLSESETLPFVAKVLIDFICFCVS